MFLLCRGRDGVGSVLGNNRGNFGEARSGLKIQEVWIITLNFSGLWWNLCLILQIIPLILLQTSDNKWILSTNPLKKRLAWKITGRESLGITYLFIPFLEDLKNSSQEVCILQCLSLNCNWSFKVNLAVF